jgi:uncharacterized protein (TIGR00255 family)
MLLSMTGFGDARLQQGSRTITAEVRTVNNRFLKCALRLPDAYGLFEADLEKLVRSLIARGTVNLTVRIEQTSPVNRYRLDTDVLAAYASQLETIADEIGVKGSNLGALLQLPGVVSERNSAVEDPSGDWHLVQSVVSDALKKLDVFRRSEGAAMADELRTNLAIIETELEGIVEQAPIVVSEFRNRLRDRVAELLSGTEAKVSDADLIREVSIFAERADINEEITRLRSHISQFRSFLDDHVSQGRKLDFLTQELFREVNTIGSKANSVAIAHRGVEMKAAVEKIREILQNIE